MASEVNPSHALNSQPSEAEQNDNTMVDRSAGGAAMHWDTREVADFWRAYKQHNNNMEKVHELLQTLYPTRVRSVGAPKLKRNRLEAQIQAINYIFTLAKNLWWDALHHRVDGPKDTVQLLLKRLVGDTLLSCKKTIAD